MTIIITRHAPLVELLRERHPELLVGEVRVLAHVHHADAIRGLHVIGVLPLHLAAVCASVTEIPLDLTPDDRGAMAAGDLPLERLREIAGEPVRYVVRSEAQIRGPVDDRLALDGATMAGWSALTHESVTAPMHPMDEARLRVHGFFRSAR